MDYRTACFLCSAPHLAAAPPDEGAEAAFAGRSNAGKSSALNAIAGRSKLARVAKLPGRTRLLNFFALDEARRLVDLPGYGFAAVSIAMRRQWVEMVGEYLRRRRSLRGIVLLMDIRHPLRERDLLLLAQRRPGLPAHILLTKADKLTRGAANATLLQVRARLAEQAPDATIQLFSSTRRSGVETVRARLDEWLS